MEIVASKTRVAPLVKLSIPRLELMGCVLAARLATYITTALGWEEIKTYYWTDSTIALAWIKGAASRRKTFVANRVQEIQRKTQPESWRHVPGLENPADLCSRGVKATELIRRSLWWKGPEWLKGTKKQWPSEIHEKNKEDIETETLKSY